MTRLKDKVAIITGAAGGIGAAMAKRFVSEGASVVLADLSEEALATVARELDGQRVAICPVDVSSSEDVKRCVQVARDKFGGLDIMMANAGIEGRVGPITEYPDEEFERVLRTNVQGAFYSIKYSAPAIAERGGGAIVLTSSIAGLVAAQGLSAYVASKHAVMGLVKGAALELAPQGIRVVSINPGPINNRMMRSIEEQASPGAAQQVKQGFENLVALHRYGENDEIAALAAFVASDEASYCTGTSFVADGGFTAQ